MYEVLGNRCPGGVQIFSEQQYVISEWPNQNLIIGKPTGKIKLGWKQMLWNNFYNFL